MIKENLKPRLFINVIESMRGIAALGVVCFHFSKGTLPTLMPNPFGDFFNWAHMGIPIFFIISGFVIPYSMYSSNYELKDAGRYFLKRMARMAPPAWASIALIFMIYFGALWLKGEPISGMTWPGTSIKAIVTNLGFSFILFDVEKYIEVYWTLEVEFQFYILIAFLLPLILKYHKNTAVLSLIFILLNATYLLHGERVLFFKYNSYFIMGILLFLYRMNLIRRNYFVYASMAAALACYLQVNMMSASASVIGILTIAFIKFDNKLFNFLGMISFSLYITHHNSGIVAEYILRGLYTPDPGVAIKFFMFLVYLAIAVSFAYLFYKLIEVPSLKLSKSISLKARKK